MSDPPSRFFEAIARRYDRAYALDARATRGRMDRVLRALPERSRVLDLGVGTGRELGALQEAGHEPVGLDLSRSMLAICARRARPVPLVAADLWGPLPFDGGAFDAVIALHGTLAHPPDRAALDALPSEIARILRPGGAFVAEVPSPALLARLDASGPIEMEDRGMRRIGEDRVLHEDRAANVSVEGLVLEPAAWRAILEARFEVEIEALGELELFVSGRRRA